MIPIELKEFYVNLKNWNFDVEPKYKVNETEAKKFIVAFERLKEIEQCKKHLQKSVLDKIRAEIERHKRKTESIDPYDLVGDCLDIIDKYKVESEDDKK